MNQYIEETKRAFSNNTELRRLLSSRARSCSRQEYLLRPTDRPFTGLLLSGTAFLISTNQANQKRILEFYEAGQLFGQILTGEKLISSCYVAAKSKCTYVPLEPQDLVALQPYLPGLISESSRKGLAHAEILGQRSLRSKLLAFFELRRRSYKSTVVLPLSLSELADYLAVDRSAMMRELKSMKEDGLISMEGKIVTLLAATHA